MGVFYIDTEYSNGNFYIGDIFELSLLSERSGRIFHRYINISGTLPRFVQQFCNVRMQTIRRYGQPFETVLDQMFQFIESERDDGGDVVALIGHGATRTDFPLIIVNCMRCKNADLLLQRMKTYRFVDSVNELQIRGYERTSLDHLNGGVPRATHSATNDVKILQNIVKEYAIDISNFLSYDTVLYNLNEKLPISISDLHKLTSVTTSRAHLESMLKPLARNRTALSNKQLGKIVNKYYYNK